MYGFMTDNNDFLTIYGHRASLLSNEIRYTSMKFLLRPRSSFQFLQFLSFSFFLLSSVSLRVHRNFANKYISVVNSHYFLSVLPFFLYLFYSFS